MIFCCVCIYIISFFFFAGEWDPYLMGRGQFFTCALFWFSGMLELMTVVRRCQRVRQVNSVRWWISLWERLLVFVVCASGFFSFLFVVFFLKDNDYDYVCLGDF